MFITIGYLLLICLDIVTPVPGRKKSVYQKDLSEICKRRIISSVFLGSGVLETDSETLDLSKLELPYDCFVKVKAEPGNNIILVAQVDSAEDLEETCAQRPNQFLALDMADTYGGYWEMLASDFSTPDYNKKRSRHTWSFNDYSTPVDLRFETEDGKNVEPISTTTVGQNNLKSSTTILRTRTVVDQKSKQNLRTIQTKTSKASKMTEASDSDSKDISSNNENYFGDEKYSDVHDLSAEMGSAHVNILPETDSFKENDSSNQNESEEIDANDDDVGKETDEDYLEEETSEEIIKVPVLVPTAHNIPLPHLYKTPKPHIHFAPRYKNIISPNWPKAKGDYSDIVDSGRIDYSWRNNEPPKSSTTLSPIIGYHAWQRQHGGHLPINKYVDYDGEDKKKTAQKLRGKNAGSSEQYFFKVGGDRKRVTANFKMLSFRTRLRYFQDAFTKSWQSTQKKQSFITHIAPHFKLKSTTKNHIKALRNKTLNFTKKFFLSSTKATNEDEKLQFSFVNNQNNKTMTPQKTKGYQKLMKVISNKMKTTGNRTLLNRPENTTQSENTTSSTTTLQTTGKISKTKMVTTSNSASSTSILTKSAAKNDKTPNVIVSTHKRVQATTENVIMKSEIERTSKMTITTINEHDLLKQLLSNFRRNAEADKIPQRGSKTTSSTTKIKTVKLISPFRTINSTTNINKTTLSTAKIQTIQLLSPSRTIKYTANVSKTTLSTTQIKTVSVSPLKSTANLSKTLTTAKIKTMESLSPLRTIKRTTLKLTSPFERILNQTKLTLKISTGGGTIELNKQDNFKPTNTTPTPSHDYKLLTTSLKITDPSNTTSLRSTSSIKLTGPVINTETLNINNDGTSPKGVSIIAKLHSSTIKSTTSLNITIQRNVTLKPNDLVNLKSTTIHSLEYEFSEKHNLNVTHQKEALTKAFVHFTSKKYQQERKKYKESNDTSTTLAINHSSIIINKDIKNKSKQLDDIVDLDILNSTTTTKKEEENNTQNVIPLAVTSSKTSTPFKKTTVGKATNATQKTTKTTIYQIPSLVTTEKAKHENLPPTTLQEVKTTQREPGTTLRQAKMFVAEPQSTTRKSGIANFSGGSNATTKKTKNLTLFSAETWNKSTLAYKSWENLIQAAPDMISSLNRTKHLWKAKLKKAKTPKGQKRLKRRVEYIPIEDSKPHTREILITTPRKTSRPTVNMVYYLADDQKEEDYGRAHYGRLERYLGKVVYNICRTETKKSRLVSLFNTSTMILIMNDFNVLKIRERLLKVFHCDLLYAPSVQQPSSTFFRSPVHLVGGVLRFIDLERLNLIVTSATTIAQTGSQCPHTQLECQVSGVRVCIDMSSACDDIPNCGAYDIYDEDRILCGFNTTFKHSLILTAVTFIVMISIVVYSIHYWLNRCVPHVSEAFFVYTDTAENVLYLDTIMRSPNATDEFPPMPYHVPEFEEGLRMRKRMVKRGLCSLLFRMICPCCKIFKTTTEAPISLEEFDKDHSDTGDHFDKMFQYSGGDLQHYAAPQDDKATQTSFTLGAIERAVSFHSKSKDSLINKLGDLRSSRSYHNELELIKKMRDNSEIKKDKRSYSKDDSSLILHTQRVTAEEEELRNTVYDMGITPIEMPPVLSSEREIIDLPIPEEEMEEALLVEPTKRLRFNEHEAGPSEGPDKEKLKKPIENKLRRTSVDLNKKKRAQLS